MIRLVNLEKSFLLNGHRHTVLKPCNAVFPSGEAVALLGRNGAGKSTLLKIIAGTLDPTAGRVESDGTISWPVGFAGSFHGDLTGAQNVRFVARVYGVDTDALTAFVEDFAGLGVHFHLPFRSYSSGMRSRLAFGVSMGIRFDTYLVDEVTSVGDANFQRRSNDVFKARIGASAAIVVSHSMSLVRKLCTRGAVLHEAELTLYDDIDEAIRVHEANMSRIA
jgi:capsular polysaccharide transport system ATP-binding protein